MARVRRGSRWTLLVLVLVAAPVRAGEVNPADSAIAKRLESKATCVAIAEGVGERVLALATKTEKGLTFGQGSKVYDGDAGVALLFAGLYRATKEQRWLDATRKTLDQALSREPDEPGLYTGWAGLGEACLEAWWATGEKHFLEQARRMAEHEPTYAGTDVIFGAAGTGIFLLNLHKATGDKAHLALALKAGDYLVKTAVRKEGAARWAIMPARKKPVYYLGFSHGAAGIGYFLLHLGLRTKHEPYLVLAEEAARFVLQHEDREGEERAHWWRTVPKSSDTRRIQWCHGAPGIGLFFHDLHRFRKKEAWTKALERCLATTQARGRSARVSGCQCHGVAGNAELFLEAYASSGKAAWLEEARKSASALVRVDGETLRAKHGVGPGATYGPSYMLGLAGIGHFFLRLADPAKTPLPMMVRP